jgi:hypothetical protein
MLRVAKSWLLLGQSQGVPSRFQVEVGGNLIWLIDAFVVFVVDGRTNVEQTAEILLLAVLLTRPRSP